MVKSFHIISWNTNCVLALALVLVQGRPDGDSAVVLSDLEV